jgi:putative membrane protein (TIGR04086 family)
MPLRPLIATPSLRALALGMVAMVLAYMLGSAALTLAVPHGSLDAGTVPFVALLLPFVVYLAAGFVAGYAAKRAPLMHGAVLGLLVTGAFAIATLVMAGALQWEALLQLAGGAIVVCSVGATAGDWIAHR